MQRTYPRLRKSEELLFWIMHKIVEIFFLSANVRQCKIVKKVVRVQLLFQVFLNYSIVIFLLLSCWPGLRPSNKSYLFFLLVCMNGKQQKYNRQNYF